jgi:hypothetical protein
MGCHRIGKAREAPLVCHEPPHVWHTYQELIPLPQVSPVILRIAFDLEIGASHLESYGAQA